MKKLFTSLAFLSAALLAFSSCNKVNSDDLEEDVPYYQSYGIEYDGSNNTTLAYGSFRARGSGGAAIEMGEETYLQVNGSATVKNNFLSLLVPTYSYQSTNLTDVKFDLHKKGGKVITNNIPLNTIDVVGFPTMPTNFSRAAGISFNYTGNEGAIEVNIKGKDLSGQDVNITKTFTTSQVTFTTSDLSSITNGTIEIRLTRFKEMNLLTSDENIGGTIKVSYKVYNSYALTT